jgi:uncharacterized protein (DUF302 family)
METKLVKVIIRMPFDTAIARLQRELANEGFEITGLTDFQHAATISVQITSNKYTVLTLYHPQLYKDLMALSPFEGVILPCFITVAEVHPEETAIVPFNATLDIIHGIQSPQLMHLTAEVSTRIDRAIRVMEKDQHWSPDLTTSWS